MAMNLESIARKAARPFVIAGASAYLILNLIGCSGNATQTPNPANNPSPKPSPTQTYKIEPTPTAVPTPTTEKPTATNTVVANAPIETIIYKTLMNRVPEIRQFDGRVVNAAVAQIRDDIYNNKLDSATVKVGDNTYDSWDYISKAIVFVLPGLSKADLGQYSDMDLRQILLPPQLRTVDIKRVIAERGINYTISGLEIALKNVTPDNTLGGKSPQEWLREEVMRDYNDKQSKNYERVIYLSTGAARIAWPNSMGAFQEIREGMLARGEIEPLFVIGWSGNKIGEQESDQLAPLVSRAIEPEPLAAYPGEAIYPKIPADGKLGIHTEPWVSYKGKLIGAWMDEKTFLKDYERSTWPDWKGELSKPTITLFGPDRKIYNPYTLKLISN